VPHGKIDRQPLGERFPGYLGTSPRALPAADGAETRKSTGRTSGPPGSALGWTRRSTTGIRSFHSTAVASAMPAHQRSARQLPRSGDIPARWPRRVPRRRRCACRSPDIASCFAVTSSP